MRLPRPNPRKDAAMRIRLLAVTLTSLVIGAAQGSDISLERRGGDIGQSHVPASQRVAEANALAYQQAVYQQAMMEQAWLAQQQAVYYGVQPVAYPAPLDGGV